MYLSDSKGVNLPHGVAGDVQLVDEDALERVDLAEADERHAFGAQPGNTIG